MENKFVRKVLDTVNPQLQIGGLEVSDAYLRFVAIKGRKVDFMSTKLPPGVIEDGRIKDRAQFASILSSFHDQIVKSKKKKIWIIASISDSNVYTEIFGLPKVATQNIDEAVKLNLQMISPIDFNTAYSDWHIVGEKTVAGISQHEILGAFVPKQLIQEFEAVFDAAGFEIVAIEFPTLALTRVLAQLSEQFESDRNYLMFRLGSDGISFGLIKNGELYFLHFVGWAAVYGVERRVSFESLKKMIIDEIHKVLSFYETHWEGTLTDMLLVTPTFDAEIKKVVAEHFPKLIVQTPALRQFKTLSLGWFSVLGSAFRGIIPRGEDSFITLATSGTMEKYDVYQATNFVKFWRNMAAGTLTAVIALLLVLEAFIIKDTEVFRLQLADLSKNPAVGRLGELQIEAAAFNHKVDQLARAAQMKSRWSGLFADVQRMAESRVTVKRVVIQAPEQPITLFGDAANDAAIDDFRKALTENPKVYDVKFDLASITQAEAGRAGFSIRFRYKDIK